MSETWIGLGAVSALLSVAMGAFAAHGLEGRLEPRMLAIFHTGAQYEMYHALALVLFGLWGLLAGHHHHGTASGPGWCFVVGTVLFSGSLYALALSGVRALGAFTPFGGVAFLIGWAWFAVLAFRG